MFSSSDLCGFVANDPEIDLNSNRGFFGRELILMVEGRFRGEARCPSRLIFRVHMILV